MYFFNFLTTQAFFGHFEKNSRPKKLKNPEKLKEIVKKNSRTFSKN